LKLLRYLVVDSLTFGGKILPSVNDLAKVEKILLWLKIQFAVFTLGAVILFYFISFSWVAGVITGALFTFVYISITLILLSGFRMSSYLKKEKKVLANKQIFIGKTKLEVEDVTYESVPEKSQLIPSIILRVIYIVVFAFTIFCGLTLGLSMLFYPDLEEQHGQEIVQNYEKAYPSLYGNQIKTLSNQLAKLQAERSSIELKQKNVESEIAAAADEFHKSFLLVDLSLVKKQLLDWDLMHHQELINLPVKISALEKEYTTGLDKLKLSIQYSKYGIYRIQHFLHKLWFLAFLMIGGLIYLFIYPFYLRYRMVLSESDLDIKLEGKTVDFIKAEFANSNQEIKKLMAEYKYAANVVEPSDPFLPAAKFKSEKVALKNQLDTFLTNELV
jgi:hypothetical protein